MLLVFLSIWLSCTTPETDQEVTFDDANLEAIIRQAIEKPSGDIRQSELDSITILEADQVEIGNITGLQYCTNLTSISLRGNDIQDISPLSNLTSLNGA